VTVVFVWAGLGLKRKDLIVRQKRLSGKERDDCINVEHDYRDIPVEPTTKGWRYLAERALQRRPKDQEGLSQDPQRAGQVLARAVRDIESRVIGTVS
jgi:hypothetical protein